MKAGVRKDYDLEQGRAGSSVTVNSLIVSEEFLESELAAYKKESILRWGLKKNVSNRQKVDFVLMDIIMCLTRPRLASFAGTHENV